MHQNKFIEASIIMGKYKITVNGENFLIKEDGVKKKFGFYTTRFVEAPDAPSAEQKAISLIREEYREVIWNDESDPPVFDIEEIKEIYSFEGFSVPGQGSTWYPEE